MVDTQYVKVKSRGEYQVFDLTDDVQQKINKSGLKNGTATVFVQGSTGALTTVEYEPGLVKDLEEYFHKTVPPGRNYHHEMMWHDGNGHSHVRASLLGPSLTIPVIKGRMTLGTWQQIIFIEFDNKPRRRDIVVQIIGE
jgi:secondary thiamine-phosphate synthase enzyme